MARNRDNVMAKRRKSTWAWVVHVSVFNGHVKISTNINVAEDSEIIVWFG